MTSDTRLTLLPTSIALFTCADTSPLKTATRFSGKNTHDFILLVLPQEAIRKIYGDVAPLIKKNLLRSGIPPLKHPKIEWRF